MVWSDPDRNGGIGWHSISGHGVDDATFSHTRGFHREPFQLEVTTATPGATLVYSTDGSTPGPGSPRIPAPDPLTPPVLSLAITSTTIVRAFVEKPGFISSRVDTKTYLFLDQVIANPAMATLITQNALWGPRMRDALLEIPTISLVTHQDIPTEPTADFMASYQGGREEDCDIIKGRSGIFVAEGGGTAWNHLVANINNCEFVQDYMDADNYIGYMLLNFYGGNLLVIVFCSLLAVFGLLFLF